MLVYSLLVLCDHLNSRLEPYFLSVFAIIEKGEIVGLLGANKPHLSSFDDYQTTLCLFPLDMLCVCCMYFRA